MNYLKNLNLLLMAASCCCCWLTIAMATETETENQRKNPAMTQDESARTDIVKQISQRYAYDSRFDERISDAISMNILRFAHDLGQTLYLENGEQSKNEIFSPLSLMSSLALLLLGARDRTYQELKYLFGLDYDLDLANNPQRFHEEFGFMLDDLRFKDGSSTHARHKVNWRLSPNTRYKITVGQRNNKPFEHIIKVANGLFVQQKYTINPDYRDVVDNVYRAQFNELDFERRPTEARNFINTWVHDATNGKIPEIINDGFPRSTNVIIASALYFKGFWENSFIEAATTDDNFYPDGPKSAPKRVPMMATGGTFPFYDAVEYGCRIIGLPYRGNLTTMYVIQPYYSTRSEVIRVQRLLDANKIEEIISKMSMKTAVLALPKMHLMRSVNLKGMLMKMGLKDLFTPGRSDLTLIGEQVKFLSPQAPYIPLAPAPVTQSAPAVPTTTLKEIPAALTDRFNEAPLIFSRFSPEDMFADFRSKRATPRAKYAIENLEKQRYSTNIEKSDVFVNDILHKVDFTVNEQGTEAAAATLTYLRRSGTDVIMRVDTPFIILIRHDPTRLPLFYGVITEPEF